MPTGYTAGIEDGKITTLRQYAMTCARAFGALVMMREDPLSAQIPEKLEPHTKYHDEGIAAARTILDSVPKMSADECDASAAAQFEAELARNVEREAEKQGTRARYETMRQNVEEWVVSDDLRGLKRFMLEQIEVSTSGGDWSYDEPVRLTGEAWRAKQLRKASENLTYHETKRAEEIARTADRNVWLQNLRDALKDYEP